MATGYLDPIRVAFDAPVVAQAATATLTAANCNGKNLTNTGAGAGIVLTLPAVQSAAGQAFKVAVLAAFSVTLTPATGEKITLNGSGVASKYLLVAGVIGNYVEIYNDGDHWGVVSANGVVTKEA